MAKKKMNEKVKERWLKSLRSGEYTQTRDELYNKKEEAFCCLGVLCDLHAEEFGGSWDDYEGYFDNSSDLPGEVQEWAGLNDSNPKVAPAKKKKKVSLSHCNDGLEFDFEKIADLIEEQL